MRRDIKKKRAALSAAVVVAALLGTAISGELVKFYDPENEVPYFSILGAIAIVVGLGLLFAVKPVLRLMKGVS